MKSFLTAVSMLSILPVGKFVPSEKDLRNAVNSFPFAGLLFGFLFMLIAHGVIRCCSVKVSAALLILLCEGLTKGFHLDGLADTFDGFFSSRSREKKLEIMHDSRIGSMGVLGIVSMMLLKFSVLSTLSVYWVPPVLASSLFLGRCGMVWHIAFSRYARKEGLGKIVFEKKPTAGMILALLLPLLAETWLFSFTFAIILTLLPAVLALIWSRICFMVIGGATGDTIGCCEELTEGAVLLFLSAVL